MHGADMNIRTHGRCSVRVEILAIVYGKPMHHVLFFTRSYTTHVVAPLQSHFPLVMTQCEVDMLLPGRFPMSSH